MSVSLGRCHYGGNDPATMTGVRPGHSGWIAVCAAHAADAERAGYRLHEHADALAESYPAEPAPAAPAQTSAAAAESRRARAAADWDELEAILDLGD